MPRSSSSFTREASLKRGGGSVKCCSGSRDFKVSFFPASRGGMLFIWFFGFILLSIFVLSYAFLYPCLILYHADILQMEPLLLSLLLLIPEDWSNVARI